MFIYSIHIAFPILCGLILASGFVLLISWRKSIPRKLLDPRPFGIALMLIILGCLQISPMASDEEMISYFKAHRGELEELLKRHNKYTAPLGKHWTWAEVPETKSLMNKIGVKEFSMIAGGLWLPTPYSRPTSQRIKFSRENLFDEKTKYSAIEIRLKGDSHYSYWSGYGIAMKHLAYYPEAPNIENGWLMLPPHTDYDFLRNRKRKYVRVIDSLNTPDNPQEWGPMDCLYRQIEPQWFITLCVGHTS